MTNFFLLVLKFILGIKNIHNGSTNRKFYSCMVSTPMINEVKEQVSNDFVEQAVSTSSQGTTVGATRTIGQLVGEAVDTLLDISSIDVHIPHPYWTGIAIVVTMGTVVYSRRVFIAGLKSSLDANPTKPFRSIAMGSFAVARGTLCSTVAVQEKYLTSFKPSVTVNVDVNVSNTIAVNAEGEVVKISTDFLHKIEDPSTVLKMVEAYLLQNDKTLSDVFKDLKISSPSDNNYETCEKLFKEANSIDFNLPNVPTHDISAPVQIHEINILSDIMDMMKFIVNYIVYLTNALNSWLISITPSIGEGLKHMSSQDIVWYFFILFLLFLLFFLIVRMIETSWKKIKQQDSSYVPNLGQVYFFSMLVGLQLSFVVIAYIMTLHLFNNSI